MQTYYKNVFYVYFVLKNTGKKSLVKAYKTDPPPQASMPAIAAAYPLAAAGGLLISRQDLVNFT